MIRTSTHNLTSPPLHVSKVIQPVLPFSLMCRGALCYIWDHFGYYYSRPKGSRTIALATEYLLTKKVAEVGDLLQGFIPILLLCQESLCGVQKHSQRSGQEIRSLMIEGGVDFCCDWRLAYGMMSVYGAGCGNWQ